MAFTVRTLARLCHSLRRAGRLGLAAEGRGWRWIAAAAAYRRLLWEVSRIPACCAAGRRRPGRTPFAQGDRAQGSCEPCGGDEARSHRARRVTLALVEDIRPGWHTYWINPGEAGQPTEIKWTLPPGWKASAVQWPYPKRIPTGPLMDYGDEGKPWLLVDCYRARGCEVPGRDRYAQGGRELARLPGHVRAGRRDAHHAARRECIAPRTLHERSPNNSRRPRAKLPVAIAMARRIPQGCVSSDPLLAARRNLALKADLRDVSFFPARPGRHRGDRAAEISQPPGAAFCCGCRSRERRPHAIRKSLDGVVVLTSSDGSVQALEVNAAPGICAASEF